MKQKDRNGKLIDQPNGQDRMLKALYGSVTGRAVLKLLVSPVVSRIAGAFLSSRLSVPLIKPFVQKNHIDLSQFAPGPYPNYNAMSPSLFLATFIASSRFSQTATTSQPNSKKCFT